MKYSLYDALAVISSMWDCHFKSAVSVTPSSRVDFTCSMGLSLMVSGGMSGLARYVMFRRDQIGRRGGGVILYVKESIQAYEIKLEREVDYDEAVWCKIVSGNSK